MPMFIRLYIEASQLLMISSLSEITNFNDYSTSRIISFSVSSFTFIFCTGILFTVFVKWRKLKYMNKVNENDTTAEFFSGLKNTHAARSFPFMSLLRVFTFVTVIILLKETYMVMTLIILVILQSICMLWIDCTRPSDDSKENIVITLNDIIFWCLLSALVYYNEESRWTNQAENIYLSVITSNSLIVAMIYACKYDLIYTI